MVRKFNKDDFVKRFDEIAKEEIERPNSMVISFDRIALTVCRELKYAQSKNQDNMNVTLKEWWINLPKRDDGIWENTGRKLGRHNCHLSSASKSSFISIGTFHGCNSMGLISRW